ncbi:hypothetical protein BLOT_014849 [Blomia tropicalis]|nr:hypothetical protein BLOT_014849 [Blomia tropicalis]
MILKDAASSKHRLANDGSSTRRKTEHNQTIGYRFEFEATTKRSELFNNICRRSNQSNDNLLLLLFSASTFSAIKKSNEIYLKKNGFLLRYMARASTTTPKRFKRRHHQRRRLLSMRVRYCYQRVMIIIIVYERNTMEAHCKLCRCSIRPRERDSNVAWCTMVQCGDNKNAITVDSCIIE